MIISVAQNVALSYLSLYNDIKRAITQAIITIIVIVDIIINN